MKLNLIPPITQNLQELINKINTNFKSLSDFYDNTIISYVKKKGDTMSGILDMGNNKITSLADATNLTEAVNLNTLNTRIPSLYRVKELNFSSWDMDVNDSFNVAHGITNWTTIQVLGVRIFNGSVYYNLFTINTANGNMYGSLGGLDSTNIELRRATGMGFDSAGFNNTSGTVIIKYEG